MKKIGIVLFFFLLLSGGVVLFFVYQTKKVQDISSQAKAGRIQTLGLLLDDCNVMYRQECLPPGGLANTAVVHSIIESTLKSQNNKAFADYKENVLGADFQDLFNQTEINTMELSTSDMLTRIAARKYVDYELLLTLMNVENDSFLSRTDLGVHPFKGKDVKVLTEINQVADSIVANMGNTPVTQFTVQNTTYTVDQNTNIGSIAVYSYLASTSTSPEIFERKVKEFPDAWRKINQGEPLTKIPKYLPDQAQEKPLPTPLGETPPPPDIPLSAP